MKKSNLDQNAQKKIQFRNYIRLFEKTAFGYNFAPQEFPNQKHTKVKEHVFQFRHFPKSNIASESRFLIKSYIISKLIFFLSVSVHISKSKEWDFPVHFQFLCTRVQGVSSGQEANYFAKWLVFTSKTAVGDREVFILTSHMLYPIIVTS